MSPLRPGPRAPSALAAPFLLFLSAGCGDDGLPKRYPVEGEVTYNGNRLPQGIVNFFPQGEGARGASGTIQDGKYRLTTLTPNDGAMPGSYRVTVTAVDRTDESKAILTQTPDAPAKYQQKYYGPPSGRQIAKANRVAKRLIPEKYENPDKSGLTRDVKPESNRIDFQLID